MYRRTAGSAGAEKQNTGIINRNPFTGCIHCFRQIVPQTKSLQTDKAKMSHFTSVFLVFWLLMNFHISDRGDWTFMDMIQEAMAHNKHISDYKFDKSLLPSRYRFHEKITSALAGLPIGLGDIPFDPGEQTGDQSMIVILMLIHGTDGLQLTGHQNSSAAGCGVFDPCGSR